MYVIIHRKNKSVSVKEFDTMALAEAFAVYITDSSELVSHAIIADGVKRLTKIKD